MSKTHEDPGGPEYDKGLTLPGFSAAEIAEREHRRSELLRERAQADIAGAERMRKAVLELIKREQEIACDEYNDDLDNALDVVRRRISAEGFGR